MAIVFEFDGDVAAQIDECLGDLREKTPAVIAQAANSTARRARKEILRGIHKKYTTSQKDKDLLPQRNISRASSKKPTATIHVRGPVNSLHDFQTDPKEPYSGSGGRPPGTRAQVYLEGGTMKMLEKGGIKAFITKFKSGDIAVVQRMGKDKKYSYTEHPVRKGGRVTESVDRPGGPRGGKGHDRIRKLWSLSVAKMAGTELKIGTTMRDEVQEMLQEELAKQIEKTLRKAGRTA